MKKILFYSAKLYDKDSFEAINQKKHQLDFVEVHLNPKTALLATGYDAVCAFVNDDLGHETLEALHQIGITVILLRCAGFNNVAQSTAQHLGLRILRVPAYSPYAVAEHALALILTLNRKTHKAYNRVREGNFLLEGLQGFDVHGKTVGVIGTGKIGQIFAKIVHGMGCRVLAYDPYPTEALTAIGGQYVALEELYREADIISLHCPLAPESYHLINQEAINTMKKGVMLINTSRGGLVETQAVIEGLKSEKIGSLGLDVYEEEADLFFENLSDHVIQDDVFMRLLSFPNVLITGHQAFLTQEALHNIAETTLLNFENALQHNPHGSNDVMMPVKLPV